MLLAIGPNKVFLMIPDSTGGYVSRQINIAFSLSQSTLRVRCNACGKGFRDCVKVKADMDMNTFTVETTHLINMSTGHCVDYQVKDNFIVKELGLQSLSDSIADEQNRCAT